MKRRTVNIISKCGIVALALLMAYSEDSCSEDCKPEEPQHMKIDVLNGMTPVKDQGNSSNCWAYAMLAAIETEHIMRGDSVNLSIAYMMRCMMRDNYINFCLTGGKAPVGDRGMGQTLLNIMKDYGAMPYDSYRVKESTVDARHGNTDYHDKNELGSKVILRKTKMIAQKAVNTHSGWQKYEPMLNKMLNESLGFCPEHVYMLGSVYTPQEFGRSVCAPGEYVALTSFTHHAFEETFALEVPDNWEHNMFYNLPLDSMMAVIDKAVKGGHGVCWEGDITEKGFSFRKGIATINDNAPYRKGDETYGQRKRQEYFERLMTTDDHCMAIVGIAHDEKGQKYYIMKNSWGKKNPYGGLVYVSEPYVRMKTIAVYLPLAVLEHSSAR